MVCHVIKLFARFPDRRDVAEKRLDQRFVGDWTIGVDLDRDLHPVRIQDRCLEMDGTIFLACGQPLQFAQVVIKEIGKIATP